MGKCRGEKKVKIDSTDPCAPPEPGGGSKPAEATPAEGPLAWFGEMIPHCLDYARAAKDGGRPVVGIACEYTPRELIMAAGAVPVCLCGGSAETIAPAEEDLPANLCPLIKSTYGFHVEKSNPFLEMADLIVAETTCDGKKKMYEMLAESRPMYVLELPQKPADADAMTHWRRELDKLKDELESRFGVTITDEKLRQATAVMNRERFLRRELASLMTSDCPPLTGRQLLDFKSSISGIPADFAQYEKAIEMLRGSSGEPATAGKVRVLLTGVPIVHGAERALEIVEDHGGLVVCMENCTGIKPILEDVDAEADDLIGAVAERYFHLPCSVMTSNERRIENLRRLAKDYRPECIIELVWQACLTYDVESFFIKQFAEKELGIPYLLVETDYSPSDSARIAVRAEALFETIRRSAAKAPPMGK